ncbi:alpha/beta hydrolase [Paenibacillus sp. CFBP13512]|nr:alpha/beta hydrolase [Paenibacillus sp. CFBP13512]
MQEPLNHHFKGFSYFDIIGAEDMTTLTYTRLINRTLEILAEQSSQEAYTYITEHANEVKGNDAQVYNFRYSLAAASGMNTEALQLLQEAILEKGYWYSSTYLLEEEDLKSLRDQDEFQKLVELCVERETLAREESTPELKILYPNDQEDHTIQQTIIALHGDQENIEIAEPYWISLLDHHYRLALPQSSQILFTDAYEWEDVEQGIEELKWHLSDIMTEDALSPSTTSLKPIVGGFSAGARVSLYTAIQDPTAFSGLILVAPWLPEASEWEKGLAGLQEAGVKLSIMCGEWDDDCLPGTMELIEALQEAHVDYQYIELPELDHDYPESFAQLLHESVTYIQSTEQDQDQNQEE